QSTHATQRAPAWLPTAELTHAKIAFRNLFATATVWVIHRMNKTLSTTELAHGYPHEGTPEQSITHAARNHLLTLAEHAITGQQLEDARDILQGLALLDR